MIVSFAYTSESLLKGYKWSTRRMWKDSHAAWFREGHAFDGWDHLPFAGGKKIAELIVTRPPYRQPITQITALEVSREGFNGMTVEQFLEDVWVGDLGGSLDDEPYVLTFRVTAVLFDGMIKFHDEGGRRMKFYGRRLPVPKMDAFVVHYGPEFEESSWVKFGWIENRGGNPFYVLMEAS